MQAVILAAGMGKRLGALTRENTKCMVEVLGRTLVERFVEQLIDAGIRRQVFVVGFQGEKLKRFLHDKFRDRDVEFEFVENTLFDRTNNIHSLYLARELLVRDDTVLLESDLVFDDELIRELVRHPKPDVVTVARYESWMDGTAVTLDPQRKVTGFVNRRQFRYHDSGEYFKTVNIYKFSRQFLEGHYVPFLEAYSRSMGNNAYYEEVLRVIAFLEKCELTGHVVERDGRWYEIDDAQDLDNAEAIFSTGRDKVRRFHARHGGYWRFPAMLDYCYLVNPYFPPPALLEEMTWNFRDLLTQYPSGQRTNALLASRMFGVASECVVVGNGAAEIISAHLSRLVGRIGVPLPTFEEYPNRIQRGEFVPLPASGTDFCRTFEELAEFSKAVDHLVLVNPDNPSGCCVGAEDVRKLSRLLLDAGKTLVLDESFMDFHSQGKSASVFDQEFLQAHPNVLLVKSISKSYGVPGLRLGIASSGNTDTILDLRRELSIWNINSFAEFFMQGFEKYRPDYEGSCRKLVQERERFRGDLETIPEIVVRPSEANFFLCRIVGSGTADELEEYLLCKEGILIKSCTGKLGIEGDKIFRAAIRNEADNRRFVAALQGFWAS